MFSCVLTIDTPGLVSIYLKMYPAMAMPLYYRDPNWKNVGSKCIPVWKQLTVQLVTCLDSSLDQPIVFVCSFWI